MSHSDVTWSRLMDAYGPATDAPKAIAALDSPDADTFKVADDYLYSAAIHQETLYTVTPVVLRAVCDVLGKDNPNLDTLLDWVTYAGECVATLIENYGIDEIRAGSEAEPGVIDDFHDTLEHLEKFDGEWDETFIEHEGYWADVALGVLDTIRQRPVVLKALKGLGEPADEATAVWQEIPELKD